MLQRKAETKRKTRLSALPQTTSNNQSMNDAGIGSRHASTTSRHAQDVGDMSTAALILELKAALLQLQQQVARLSVEVESLRSIAAHGGAGFSAEGPSERLTRDDITRVHSEPVTVGSLRVLSRELSERW